MQYDHSCEVLCLNVVSIKGVDDASNVYFKMRSLPRYNQKSYKQRSDQQKTRDKWMFRAPCPPTTVALQLRVHTGTAFKKQQDTVLGEVLLDTEALITSTREIIFELQLLPLQQTTPDLEEMLQLLSGRSHDAEAKDFIAMYPREHDQGFLSMFPQCVQASV